MSCTRADILAELERAERPLPSCIIAQRLGRANYTVGAVLSKLAMYGKIHRVKVPRRHRSKPQYLYSIKPVQQPHDQIIRRPGQ